MLRLTRENNGWGYRRIHGELLVPGITVTASTLWEILKDAGIDPAAQRTTDSWAAFLRSQAEAILTADVCETVTLTGSRMYLLTVIEHATRQVRVLDATAYPPAAWVTAVRTLTMDLQDARCRARVLIRDRDVRYPPLFDANLADTGIQVVHSGVRMPHMNATMERWIQSCHHELLDRTVIWNQTHLPHALREYEQHHNAHRPHRGITNARPPHPLPEPITAHRSPLTDPATVTRLDIRRHDRLGGIIHEYQHAA